MEENKPSDTNDKENKEEVKIVQPAPKKAVAPRKPAARKPVVKPEMHTTTAHNAVAESKTGTVSDDEMTIEEDFTDAETKKLDKKNLKKLKKMSDKIKEKEKKQKQKQKEKEKKAKKKKKEKAKKEKAKKKLKEKKAAAKKKKSKKK